jgi:hypothetical protein
VSLQLGQSWTLPFGLRCIVCGEAWNAKEKGVVESGGRTMDRTDAPAWSQGYATPGRSLTLDGMGIRRVGGGPYPALGRSECCGENLVASLGPRPNLEDLGRLERGEFLDPLFEFGDLFLELRRTYSVVWMSSSESSEPSSASLHCPVDAGDLFAVDPPSLEVFEDSLVVFERTVPPAGPLDGRERPPDRPVVVKAIQEDVGDLFPEFVGTPLNVRTDGV